MSRKATTASAFATPSFFPVSKPHLVGRELDYVSDAVKSGWVSSLGHYVTRFEHEFAAFCGVRHAISVANGTAALHLALVARRIGPGDEVILPDLSAITTANATLMAGARPVFCDIEPASLCIDPSKIEALITARTRAIIPVHLYGHPAAMGAIMQIAKKRGLSVIEDAAQAHGSAIGSTRVGALGHCSIFSFYANKNLTTGEGGMITTNAPALADKIRHLRDHAMSAEKRYWHDQMGFDYRMTNLQAALGCAQLEQAKELLAKRRAVFEGYKERLADLPELRVNREMPGVTNSFWMVCAEIDGLNAENRDQLCLELRARGVDTRPYFYPMSDMPYLPGPADTPIAHAAAARGFNLPTYIDLSESDLDEICTAVKSVARRYLG